MLKYLLVLHCSLFIHFAAFAQASADTDTGFEAELQLLEKNELDAENKQMKAVEELSSNESNDMVEDSISNTQAAPIRKTNQEFLEYLEIKPESKIKTRRIRSR